MADVRVKSNGREFYRIDGGVAALLMALMPEALEKIERPTFNVQDKPNQAQPRWAVQKSPWSDKMEICLTILNRTLRYPGPECKNPTPEDAKAVFKSASGHEPPAHILAEFAAVLKSASGLDAEQQLSQRLNTQTEQYAREQQERVAEAKLKITGQV